MAISGLPVNLTAVAPDTSTAIAAAAAKSKAAAPSVTPQDTVTISSQAQLSPAGAIDVAPPVLLEVEELLTQGLSASQIAVTLITPSTKWVTLFSRRRIGHGVHESSS